MRFANPPSAYDRRDQAEVREQIQQQLDLCFKADRDLLAPAAVRVVLTSPDGSLFALSASDAGVLSLVPYP